MSSSRAHWRGDDLNLTFEQARPDLGLLLEHLSLPTACAPRLFGLVFPTGHQSHTRSCPPLVACGGDLGVAYDAVDAFPVRTGVAWKVRTASQKSGGTIVDLVLSVDTEDPGAQPQFSVRSEVPAVEVLTPEQPHANGGARWNPWTPSQELSKPAITPVILFRLPGEMYSYLEMACPVDSDVCRLTRHADPAVALERTLFATTLERGVILRARLRGVLLGRADDTARAAEAYADFVRSEPPLGR